MHALSEPVQALVVDDERGPRESLRMILEPLCDVRVAKSGSEALELMQEGDVQLMTLDLSMPGMMGQEVMHTVRAQYPDTEIIVVTGAGSVESAAESVRAGICDYLTKPFDVVQVGAAVSRALSRRRSRDRLTSFLNALGEVVGRDREIEELLDDVQRSQKVRGRLELLFDEHARSEQGATGESDALQFLEVLAETIETKDPYMRGHARRVSVYASLLAKQLGLPGDETEHVRIAAFLHDLGKVGVDSDLLRQEDGLDPAQREAVERHAELGARLLQPLDIPPGIAAAVRHHHEWWDGTGYPDGMAGEDIPIGARIIAIADAFDAMSCDRPFRAALARDVVMAELDRYAGIQFDPRLCQAFHEVLEQGAGPVEPVATSEAA